MAATMELQQQLAGPDARRLAEAAYRRFAEVAGSVTPQEWTLPTDCEGWTVRDLVGHMVGAMRSAASMREFLRQFREISRRAKATGANQTDVMTALQIELVAGLGPEQLVAECRRLVGPAARGRTRPPAPIRRWIRFPVTFGATTETWRLDYLLDVILTRDAWMHSVDLSRALGRQMALTPHLDGQVIAGVAQEWGRRHGQAVTLRLTGPAGGEFVLNGTGGETIEIDAVDFARSVSGRQPQPGLLSVDVPF